MSLKKNILKNGLASALQKGIRVAEQLLLVPFFISAWGAAYYGEWLTLTIIPTILGFSDLGFGSAAANSFILRYASNDKQGAANISKSGFLSIHLIVASGIIISFLALFILNHFHVFDKSLIDTQDAILALSFLMIARIVGFYNPLNEAYFKSARKAAFSINLYSINSVSNLITGILILSFKGGIVLFALSNLIIAVFFTSFYAVMAHRTLPLRKEAKGTVLATEIKTIFKKGFGYLLSPVWQAIFFQGTTFVVRIVLGPVAVTIFNTVRTLTRAVNQANSMVIASVIPEIQYEIGAGNLPQARKLFRFGLSTITLIALVGVVFLYFGGPWLYEIWTRKALNPPDMMWNIFLVGILFNAMWWMSSDMLISANKPYQFTVPAVIITICAVVLSYLLSIYFGLTGAAIGSLMLDLALFFYILPSSCRLIEQPLSTLFKKSIYEGKEVFKSQIINLKKYAN